MFIKNVKPNMNHQTIDQAHLTKVSVNCPDNYPQIYNQLYTKYLKDHLFAPDKQ